MPDVPATQRREARAGRPVTPLDIKPRPSGPTVRMRWVLEYLDRCPDGCNAAQRTKEGLALLTAYRDTFLPGCTINRARHSVWRVCARLEVAHGLITSELVNAPDRKSLYNHYRINAKGRDVLLKAMRAAA